MVYEIGGHVNPLLLHADHAGIQQYVPIHRDRRHLNLRLRQTGAPGALQFIVGTEVHDKACEGILEGV